MSILRVCNISRLFYFGPLSSNMGEEPIEPIEGADDIRIGVMCAIRPWSGQTGVEVESKILPIFGSRLLCELKVALEEIVVTTP